MELTFDESNVNAFELENEYQINGTIFGDEGEQPNGIIELTYGDTYIGEIEIIGNQGLEYNFYST